MKKHEVPIPEGYEVVDTVTGNYRDERISTTIVFKPTKKELPKTWEELEEILGYFISPESHIRSTANLVIKDCHKNVWPTKELAEAALALSQLCQLRDHYNDGWEPDWGNNYCDKFVIIAKGAKIKITIEAMWSQRRVMTLKSESLANEFLSNFRDLIETAEPLL